MKEIANLVAKAQKFLKTAEAALAWNRPSWTKPSGGNYDR